MPILFVLLNEEPKQNLSDHMTQCWKELFNMKWGKEYLQSTEKSMSRASSASEMKRKWKNNERLSSAYAVQGSVCGSKPEVL